MGFQNLPCDSQFDAIYLALKTAQLNKEHSEYLISIGLNLNDEKDEFMSKLLELIQEEYSMRDVSEETSQPKKRQYIQVCSKNFDYPGGGKRFGGVVTKKRNTG